MRELLDAGSNPSVKMLSGDEATTLYLAIQSGDVQTVEVVLSSDKVDVDVELKGGITPLLSAIDRNRLDLLVALLAKGADPNKGVGGGGGVMQHPLLFAVVKGRHLIVKELLRKGASCGIVIGNSRGDRESLLDFTRTRRDFDTMQVLSSFKECTEAFEDENIIPN